MKSLLLTCLLSLCVFQCEIRAADRDDYDIGFVMAEERGWELWLKNSIHGNRKLLSMFPVDIRTPAWSPDGTTVAYATRDGKLYLQSLAEQATLLDVSTVQNSEPAWSPDGKYLVYTSYTNPRGYKSELWLAGLTADNTLIRADKINIPSGLVTFPSWYGNTITYSRLESVNYSGVIENICRFDRNTGVESTIIADGFDNIHPAWSPDGKILAYASNKAGNFDIWLWNTEDNSTRQLTVDPSLEQHPAWSADGSNIAFTSSRTGKPQVWMVEVESGRLRQIGYGKQGSRDPVWRGSSTVSSSRL